MQQHGWCLKPWCWVKKARHKESSYCVIPPPWSSRKGKTNSKQQKQEQLILFPAELVNSLLSLLFQKGLWARWIHFSLKNKFLADNSESRTYPGQGGRSWGVWAIFKVQPSPLHLNCGGGRTCAHQAAFMESKRKTLSWWQLFESGSPQTLGGIPTNNVWLLLKAQTNRFFKDCPQIAEPKG